MLINFYSKHLQYAVGVSDADLINIKVAPLSRLTAKLAKYASSDFSKHF